MTKQQEHTDTSLAETVQPFWETGMKMLTASGDMLRAFQNYWVALMKYENDFLLPLLKAMSYFSTVESQRILHVNPLDTLKQYEELLHYNCDIYLRDRLNSIEAVNDYHVPDLSNILSAWLNTLDERQNGEDIFDFISHKARIAEALAQDYPQEIRDIAEEFGFHFERGGHEKIAETDRFVVYQVLPTEPGIEIRGDSKPILIVHPYVLGADILSFLPSEKKSYVHCFANNGIPTYVRILKSIDDNHAVQTITLEDDIRDTKFFCERIKQRHNRSLTLNGYCQGGLMTLANILSGELDGLVDCHITCVAPIDGTRSKGFSHFLGQLPHRFNDLAYGTKKLDNGNTVADGDLMAWVYKVKSIDDEAPVVSFYRDLSMMRSLHKKGRKISKTAAALNYWLTYQRHDLPLEITKLSFASYNTPITSDGTLPFTAFGRKLNMKRIQEKGVKWLICYGVNDSLVEKDTALAPLDYVDVEVSPFPKGHVAIATSWSLPTSECALHCQFGEDNIRGPVRFHLDQERAEDEQVEQKPQAKKKSATSKQNKEQKSDTDTDSPEAQSTESTSTESSSKKSSSSKSSTKKSSN